MDLETLDQALLAIVEKRNELQTIDYQDTRYDQIEEELHELEDDFIKVHGAEMEHVIQEVHDKLCPDTDVLLPIAYLAKHYFSTGKNSNGSETFDVEITEGVPVILDEYPNQPSKMVLLPAPPRLILQVSSTHRFQVWP